MFKRIHLAVGFAAAVTASGANCLAQLPELPKPTKEHEALAQFAGEWETKAECVMAPGQEPMVCYGSESSKLKGGFWLVAENDGDMMGTKVTSTLTIGYSPQKKKYVATFVSSCDSTLWVYEGEMDKSGKKVSLLTEGPLPTDPSKIAKFREVLELKDKDHKTFTSYLIEDGGKETKFVTMEYTRKK